MFDLNLFVMESLAPFLTRPLTAREKYRYLLREMLPVDAVDPYTLTNELRAKVLYKYGCELEDMNLVIFGNNIIDERSPIFQMRGFGSFFTH